MKIAAYEVRRDEQKDFAFIAEKLGVELTEAEDNLTLENIDTVNGAEAVTILGRTRLTAPAHRRPGARRKYISTRTIGADTSTSPPQRSSASRCATPTTRRTAWQITPSCSYFLACASISPPCGAHRSTTTLAGLQGRELRNLTVGILGTGKIGAASSKI